MTSLAPRTGALPNGVRRVPRGPIWMLEQLPAGLLDSDFFVRFVSIFQELGETLLADADNIENVIDVTVAPEEMVRWVGSWIGVEGIDAALPGELQRRIVESSADTLAWRGTARGLCRFLELISGGPVEVEDGGGVWRAGERPPDTAWVRMRVESTGWMPESDFAALVRDEVPAHVRAQLWLGDRLIWTTEDEKAP
ncbi:MAG TPA: phage tail protein [Jatrophihabitans sp.]|jgi:phage tail-like protein|nr:phage tail protein [Jatrophihabitans sp.]